MKRPLLILSFALSLSMPARAGVFEDLFDALHRGDAETVIALIERGVDVNTSDAQGDTLLHHAVRQGNEPLAQVLLARRANPNRRNRYGDTPLMIAALAGKSSLVKRLLAHGAKPDLGGWNALHYAAYNGHAEILPLLLAAGAELDKPAPNGETALLLAARNGHLEAVRILVGAGADVNRRAQGKTALDLALSQRYEEVAIFLRRAGSKEGLSSKAREE